MSLSVLLLDYLKFHHHPNISPFPKHVITTGAKQQEEDGAVDESRRSILCFTHLPLASLLADCLV